LSETTHTPWDWTIRGMAQRSGETIAVAKIRFMTALLVAKALLPGFLIVACGALTVTYVRRRRAGVQPWENPYASTYLDIYRGGLPPIPPPP